MNKLATCCLLLTTAITAASPAPAQDAPTCESAPDWVAEGSAVDPDGGAAELAEQHARAVARGWCENLGDGHPVFLHLETQETGESAVTTARFACSNDC